MASVMLDILNRTIKEGDIVEVKITKANSFSLNGEMVK